MAFLWTYECHYHIGATKEGPNRRVQDWVAIRCNSRTFQEPVWMQGFEGLVMFDHLMFTECLQYIVSRLVESQETRRQLCGGQLLLRIRLAPDEVPCKRIVPLCNATQSVMRMISPFSDFLIILGFFELFVLPCHVLPVPDAGSITLRARSIVQLGATGGISSLSLPWRSGALQEVDFKNGAAIWAVVRLQQHCFTALIRHGWQGHVQGRRAG